MNRVGLKAFPLLIALAWGVSSLGAEEIKHSVKSGDTLSQIAKDYGVNVVALRAANGIDKSSNTIKVGEELVIPMQKKDASLAKSSSIKGHSSGTINLALTTLTSKKVAKTNKKSKLKSVLIAHASTFEESQDVEIVTGNTQSVFINNSKLASIPSMAKQKLGKRYVWGAVGPNTFDCSGFTMYTCKQEGITIPRTSIEQSKSGIPVPRYALKPGDLVFFDTSKTKRGYVNHVGIYIGNDKFIHASSAKKKVTITSLEAPFYKARYKGARRYY